ncbi:MAG: hypothetical protein HY670_03755 [Chloroflexi bacterium]|nr:hypothetical protein [Chloroflexota bacterium]
MSEELGKIERPPVSEFKAGRRLYFVPLVFAPREPEPGLAEIVQRYWEQVEAHLANLEAKLGAVHRVYHELVPVGGEDGIKILGELCEGSHQIAKCRLEKGAELTPIEDRQILAEFMDWSRCLAIGMQSQQALTKVYECYVDAQKRRNDFIARQIDETLQAEETGLLLVREGHQVTFPTDIEVFYVAPPGLDELKRWVRQREAAPESGESEKEK